MRNCINIDDDDDVVDDDDNDVVDGECRKIDLGGVYMPLSWMEDIRYVVSL